MNMKMGLLIVVAIVGVLAVVLAFKNIYGGDWDSIAGAVAWVVLMIAFLGFALAVVVKH
jgi:hypothetical protein